MNTNCHYWYFAFPTCHITHVVWPCPSVFPFSSPFLSKADLFKPTPLPFICHTLIVNSMTSIHDKSNLALTQVGWNGAKDYAKQTAEPFPHKSCLKMPVTPENITLYSLSGVAPTLACRMSLAHYTHWCGPHTSLSHVSCSLYSLVWPPHWPVTCLLFTLLTSEAPTLACHMSLAHSTHCPVWPPPRPVACLLLTLLTVWCGPHAGLSHVSQLVLHALDPLVQVLDLRDQDTPSVHVLYRTLGQYVCCVNNLLNRSLIQK